MSRSRFSLSLSALICFASLPVMGQGIPAVGGYGPEAIAQALKDLSALHLATVNASGVLMSAAEPSTATFEACQPLAGARVFIVNTVDRPEGIQGLRVHHVEVLDGPCKGTRGWIGTTRLSRS